MLSGPVWTSAAELYRVHMNPMPPVMNDAFDLAPGCIPSSLYQTGLHSCATSKHSFKPELAFKSALVTQAPGLLG